MRIGKSEVRFMDLLSSTTFVPLNRFFESYWQAIDERGWRAVILHSWQGLPEKIDSDIDHSVTGVSSAKFLEFLGNHCRECGWHLIQSIEHEPEAFFCVCVQSGPPFASLQLDVCWSYRRLGHSLIDSSILFDGSRRIPGKSFMAPSAGAEFAYILAKAAAKGKSFAEVRSRLVELWEENADECHATAQRAFGEVPPRDSADQIDPLVIWETWFSDAPCFRAVRKGRRWGTREIALYLRRILQPTGYFLSINGTLDGESRQRIEEALMPAFRARLLVDSTGWLARLRHWVPLIRTQLVIGTSAACSEGGDGGNSEALIHEAIETLAARTCRRIRSM